MVNKGMSNKTITTRRPVQQLIPLEMSRDPAEELNHCKDTDRDFEKRRSLRTAANNVDLMRRLNGEK